MIQIRGKIRRHAAGMIIPAALALSLQGCFTGIESTPKITANDVKKENIRERDENKFLADIEGEPIEKWEKGKLFYVTDDKIAILFGGSSEETGSLKGKVIMLESIKDVTSITGEPVAEFTFRTSNGKLLRYKNDRSFQELREQTGVNIPFTIEESLVDQVRDRIQGKKYYILTSMWYDMADQSLTGYKYIPVTIAEVHPGNSVYPIRLILTDDTGKRFALFMATGSNQKAPRGFGSLFSFTDPHLRYPGITDETWDNIIKGRVSIDMTREECRLALGPPANISRNTGYDHLHEMWTYENGIYLVFEDGLLRSYRR